MNLKYLYTLILGLFVFQTATAQRKGYWQQTVDYKMNIDVNEKTYQYNGNMQLKYSNNSGQSLKKVYFHLYFNAFQPGSMMDNRLANIADPDKRMTTNLGTKDKPKYQSRIATLTAKQIGYQKIKSLTMNGNNTSFKVDGTLLEVTLPNAIEDGETATFDMKLGSPSP
ncbi:hypothetical protein ACFX5U_00420 [Sphingobacterium sp. SG20118]|uniref:hypothetical protein n=1 Tax=Sphingobacterium sp. SG20118 TaxID=3367156 RepID=UPI0037DFC792